MTKNGYLFVCLCKNGKSKPFRINRLVAEAFIDNPENKPQVNHIDGNKQNNRADNLEWCTRSENMRHAYKTGLKTITEAMLEKSSKPINQYDLQGNFMKEWSSMMEVERELNIKHVCISCACKGKQKTAGGFIWKYKEVSK